jgi:hypothetical protein
VTRTGRRRRPADPIAHDTDTPAATLLSAGGQAANTAAWICALGGRARLIAARAPDLAGQLVAAELGRRGVDLKGPVLDGRTGTVVSVSPDGTTRSMLTDRGVGPELAAGHLEPGGWTAATGCTCPPTAWPPSRSRAPRCRRGRHPAAVRRPVLGGRAEGLRPGPVPRPARAAGARGGVRQRPRPP